MSKLVVAANFFNEINQLPEWFKMAKQISDDRILIVDSGSVDGTIKYCEEQGAMVFTNDIVIRDGYGDAKNHLRHLVRKNYPDAEWMLYLDADERIDPESIKSIKELQESLPSYYDIVAFPRIDWVDKERSRKVLDMNLPPDYHGRMTRIKSNVVYIRKSHEAPVNFCNLHKATSPIIHHFRHCVDRKKRDYIKKLHVKLYYEDPLRLTYFDAIAIMNRKKYLKEGLFNGN